MVEHVVVSGASGFIGASVVHDLVARDIGVTALVRETTSLGRLRDLDGLDIVRWEGVNSEAVSGILRDRRPTSFIHSAWRGVAGHERNEMFQSSENLPLTLEAVNLAASAGCVSWVGLGSQAEYGPANQRISESHPTTPTTLYGVAKLAAGREARERCRELDIACSWIRIFSTYGPGDSPDWFIPSVIRALLRGERPRLTACEQMWDYLFVADAARCIVDVARRGIEGIFNLGSGTAFSLRVYVEAIRQRMGIDILPMYGAIPYRPDQVMHLEADISRIQRATGWHPRVDLNEGIRQTVAYERNRVAR